MRKHTDARRRLARSPRCIESLEPRTLMTAVTSVLVNGTDAAALGQRSIINTIAIRFDANVGPSINPADLRLWNGTTRQFVDTSAATTSYNAAANTATWAFPFQAGRPMLPEGNYRATLQSMTVYDAAGKPLDGDTDGVGGDEYNFTFHRFFGDSDGDRDVDARDAIRLRLARWSTDPQAKAPFDSNGDGVLNARDVLALRRNLRSKLKAPTGNRPPAAPVINEPSVDGQLIDAQDLHMQIEQAFVDPDQGAPDPQGLSRSGTDWEVWTRGAVPERVFHVDNSTQFDSKVHVHFGDGVFENSLAGKRALLPDTNYLLRVRHRDSSGDPGTTNSNWDVRLFRTRTEDLPTAAGWVAKQAGYEVQEIPFVFGAGEPQWSLPVNIAFVPQSVARTGPKDPLFYVTELYGKVRVVTHDYTVYTYASGLLNYDPTGPFGGSGENGLTGLAIDPSNGDVFVNMLYAEPAGSSSTFPKVTRFRSTDGGLHATDTNASQAGTQGVDILKMPGESMRQSHIISNLTFGPDDKLYVHVGDGFDATRGQEDNTFRGKILRINRDGSPATDNPHYSAADAGNDGKPDPTDYWFAKGLRNPFGGAWRDANPAAGTPAQHFTVENGPSLDRFTMLVRDRNYLYDGTNESMKNFNIAWSPLATGAFENGERDWDPSPAPVNITFAQASAFGGSGFPTDKLGHAFVTLSGSTHASGTSSKAKLIEEWVLNPDGTRHVPVAGEPANPRDLVKYQGTGYSTAAAIAAGPGGLYFSTLYPDTNADPTAPGAKILRVVYTGGTVAAAAAAAAAAPDPEVPADVPAPAEDPAVRTVTPTAPPVAWAPSLFSDDAAALRKLREDGAHALLHPAFGGRS